MLITIATYLIHLTARWESFIQNTYDMLSHLARGFANHCSFPSPISSCSLFLLYLINQVRPLRLESNTYLINAVGNNGKSGKCCPQFQFNTVIKASLDILPSWNEYANTILTEVFPIKVLYMWLDLQKQECVPLLMLKNNVFRKWYKSFTPPPGRAP